MYEGTVKRCPLTFSENKGILKHNVHCFGHHIFRGLNLIFLTKLLICLFLFRTYLPTSLLPSFLTSFLTYLLSYLLKWAFPSFFSYRLLEGKSTFSQSTAAQQFSSPCAMGPPGARSRSPTPWGLLKKQLPGAFFWAGLFSFRCLFKQALALQDGGLQNFGLRKCIDFVGFWFILFRDVCLQKKTFLTWPSEGVDGIFWVIFDCHWVPSWVSWAISG